MQRRFGLGGGHLASTLLLGNLTAIVDYNKLQSFGRTNEVINQTNMVERWKTELTAEGVFAGEKRELPLFPTRIGVVTSPDGAAIQDIQNVISRRYPIEIVLSPLLYREKVPTQK
jgi:exonuclease VII large subunit